MAVGVLHLAQVEMQVVERICRYRGPVALFQIHQLFAVRKTQCDGQPEVGGGVISGVAEPPSTLDGDSADSNGAPASAGFAVLVRHVGTLSGTDSAVILLTGAATPGLSPP